MGAQKSVQPGQLSPKLLKNYQEGIKYLKQGSTKEAIKIFDKILKKEVGFHEANLRKAGVYYDAGDFEQAAKIFEHVIKADSSYNYEMYYAAAINAKKMKDYESSTKHFATYLLKVSVDEARKKKIKREIEENQFRAYALKHPKNIQPIKVVGEINSGDHESLPFITLEGNKMVFTRRINGQEDLYTANLNEEGKWIDVQAVSSINTDNNEGAQTMSADGKMIVFTRCHDLVTSFGGCDLYYSKNENGLWSTPANMGPKVNTPAWESQPCILDNGRAIIFSSNRKGGLGGNDLWIIRKAENGKWGDAVNLGSIINTPQDEESPFMHYDGKTFYFRSNGHIGMGNFDLFKCKWQPKSKDWSIPENLGYPINTEGPEGSMFIERSGKLAYLASDFDALNNGRKNLDIYQFELPLELQPEPTSYIKVVIKHANNGSPIDAPYLLVDLSTGDTISNGYSYDGQILLGINQGINYSLTLKKEAYFLHSENINTEEHYSSDQPFVVEILLKPVNSTPEKAIVLNNIFFKTASAELLPTSHTELQNLVNFLNENKIIKIKVIGHTDDIGNDQDNLFLSEARAKAVYDVLISNGISASRLAYEGRGEREPIAQNNTEEGRSKNRRTEFIVMK